MWLINRIGLLLIISISFPILLILSIISVKFAVVYLAWTTENIFKFIYGTKEKI